MKKYRCIVCEWIYDPAVGDPDGGIKKRERLLCSLRKIIIFVCRAFCAVQSKFI